MTFRRTSTVHASPHRPTKTPWRAHTTHVRSTANGWYAESSYARPPRPPTALKPLPRGCAISLRVLTSATTLGAHRAACQLWLTTPPMMSRVLQYHQQLPTQPQGGGRGVLTLGCKMVARQERRHPGRLRAVVRHQRVGDLHEAAIHGSCGGSHLPSKVGSVDTSNADRSVAWAMKASLGAKTKTCMAGDEKFERIIGCKIWLL